MLAKLIHMSDKQEQSKKILMELLLGKTKNILDTQSLVCRGWPIQDNLYDILDDCFQVNRVVHCNPYNLPLRANTNNLE